MDNVELDPDAIAGHSRDGRIEVSLTEDLLEARGEFIPPLGRGRPIDLEYAEKLFESRGITSGIDWDNVREAILECNSSRKKLSDVAVAKGIKPKPEIPAHYAVRNGLLKDHQPKLTASGKIDHKAVSPYTFVHKDDVLAVRVDRQEGREGTGVTGEPVSFDRREVDSYSPGEGTYTEENKVKASFSGRFALQGESLAVTQYLEIRGSIDYHTGHVIFPGDVTVTGEIREGFQVYAGGSVYCKETIEASEVIAKKNIVSQMGIIGKEKGIIRTGGGLEAKFVESCRVKSRGRVFIHDSILNSHVKTLDRIETGEGGKIVGGELTAVHGITASQIGNEAFHHTYVQCGVDFVAQKELDKAKKKHLALYLKLQTVDTMLKEKGSKELESLKTKINEQLTSLIEKMNELLDKVSGDENAEIVVNDKVYPGTTIDICHTDFIVEEVMSRVKFRLDRKIGRVAAEPLG